MINPTVAATTRTPTAGMGNNIGGSRLGGGGAGTGNVGGTGGGGAGFMTMSDLRGGQSELWKPSLITSQLSTPADLPADSLKVLSVNLLLYREESSKLYALRPA